MRPGQNKRMRGRNNNGGGSTGGGGRKGPNPLTRSYESNGPDVKIRGTAHHVAEKYLQLARDAQTSGDPVAAESYLQHAEHYFRLIASAQQAQQQAQQGYVRQPGELDAEDDGDDDDFSGLPDRFASPAERFVPPPPPPPVYAERPYSNERPQGQQDNRPYQDRQVQGQDRPQQERPQQERAYQNDRPPRQDRPFEPRNTGNGQQQRRPFRPNGDGYEPREFRPQPQPQPQPVALAQPQPDVDVPVGLPAFITAPVRANPEPLEAPSAVDPGSAPQPDGEIGRFPPRRRRRSRVAQGEGSEGPSEAPTGEVSGD